MIWVVITFVLNWVVIPFVLVGCIVTFLSLFQLGFILFGTTPNKTLSPPDSYILDDIIANPSFQFFPREGKKDILFDGTLLARYQLKEKGYREALWQIYRLTNKAQMISGEKNKYVLTVQDRSSRKGPWELVPGYPKAFTIRELDLWLQRGCDGKGMRIQTIVKSLIQRAAEEDSDLKSILYEVLK